MSSGQGKISRVDYVLLRVVLPFTLFGVSCIRYNVFSFVYLLFLLACPHLPLPTSTSSKKKNQIYLMILVILSCIFSLSHPTLHIIIAVAPPYEDALVNCTHNSIASQIGVQKLNEKSPFRVMRLVVPDIFTLTVAVISLVQVSRRARRPDIEQSVDDLQNDTGATLDPRSKSDAQRRKMWRAWAFDTLCMLISVLLICFAAITSPSMPSTVYLLSFLGICTYWAIRSEINTTPFVTLRIFLLTYSGIHVCIYYLYQFPFFQSICRDGSFLARLLGLHYIMRTDCITGEFLFAEHVRVVDCIAPPLIMLLYYVLVYETWRWFKHEATGINSSNANGIYGPEVLFQRDQTLPTTVETVAVRNASNATVSYADTVVPSPPEPPPVTTTTTAQVPASSVSFINSASVTHELDAVQSTPILLGEQEITYAADHESIERLSTPLIESGQALRTRPTARPKRFRSNRLHVNVDTLFGLTPPFAFNIYGSDNSNMRTERPLLLSLHYSAIRNSYILTLIAMMAWAVTYPSWLSFILLLSACILWVVPNSRTACLYTSPLIVFYGIVLILIQYVYGMNMNTDELPEKVTHNGIELSELGMKRWDNSVGALGLQVVFLICFWLTLRLFVMERSVTILTNSYSRRRQAGNCSSLRHRREVEEPEDYSSLTTPPVSRTLFARYLDFINLHIRNTGSTLLTPDRRFPGFASGGGGVSTVSYQPSGQTAAAAAATAAWFGVPFGTVDNTAYQKFTDLLHSLCVKYWIVVCCLSMLLISIQQPVVIFRIVYMIMLVYFLLLFQVSYNLWRRQMLIFWWVNVAYSMGVLLCIYTFQFDKVPEFWQNTTGLSEDILKDIGLESFSSAIFEQLLTPVIFLVIIILQVHYFHRPFLKRSALDHSKKVGPASSREHPDTVASTNPREPLLLGVGSRLASKASDIPADRRSNNSSLSNFIEDVNSAFHTVIAKLTVWVTRLTNCCWRFLEIHWIKLVALVIMLNVIKEVCLPNIVSLTLLVFCFPFPYLHGCLTCVIYVITGLQILVKMGFQLNSIVASVSFSCNTTKPLPPQLVNPLWFGLFKVDNFYYYILPLGSLLVVTVIWHAITYRQRQFYNDPQKVRPKDGIVFANVTVQSMDYDLVTALKFAINYGFYKFGLELCHCITVVTACLRADAYSVFYLLLLLIFLFTPRSVCARLWLPYVLILAVLLPVQYAGCIGIPPGACWTYPWITAMFDIDNLLQWLYLPGSYGLPMAKKLIADFFQFAVVSLQYNVFKLERTPGKDFGGGSNRPVLRDNPLTVGERDFISTKESYLDYLRHALFYWSYWVSLAVVLATGVTWITLFCLGYMILSFIYLWMGQNVMLRKRINLIRSWNVIIGYNFCVILAKCSFQLVGCVFRSKISNQCWLIQLFGVQCMNPFSWGQFTNQDYVSTCTAVSSGLHWDVICFIFILLQRKVFMTYSFAHVVLDLNTQSQFASRGAYLINQRLMSVITEQMSREHRCLERISQKLENIRKRQDLEHSNLPYINEHYIMLRSGDYDLFKGDPEQEDDDSQLGVISKGSSTDNPPSSSDPRGEPSLVATFQYCPISGVHRPITAEEEEAGRPRARTLDAHTGRQMAAKLQPSGHVMPTNRLVPISGSVNGVADGSGLVLKASRFNEQHRHLTETLPDVELSVVDTLANYTDPYLNLTKNQNQVTNSLFASYRTTGARYMHHLDGGSSVALARQLGHRRMHSHPEYPRLQFGSSSVSSPVGEPTPATATAARVGQPGTPSRALRSVQTSPTQLVEQQQQQLVGTAGRARCRLPLEAHHLHRRPSRQDSSVGSGPRRTAHHHRRLLSASSAMAMMVPDHEDGPLVLGHGSSPALRERSVGQPPMTAANGGGEAPTLTDTVSAVTGLSTEAGTSRPQAPGSNSALVDPQPDPLLRKARSHDADVEVFSGEDFDDYYYYEDPYEDDEDDANPMGLSTGWLKPLDLLNQAIERGACITARQFRRSLQLGGNSSVAASSSGIQHRVRANAESTTTGGRYASSSGVDDPQQATTAPTSFRHQRLPPALASNQLVDSNLVMMHSSDDCRQRQPTASRRPSRTRFVEQEADEQPISHSDHVCVILGSPSNATYCMPPTANRSNRRNYPSSSTARPSAASLEEEEDTVFEGVDGLQQQRASLRRKNPLAVPLSSSRLPGAYALRAESKQRVVSAGHRRRGSSSRARPEEPVKLQQPLAGMHEHSPLFAMPTWPPAGHAAGLSESATSVESDEEYVEDPEILNSVGGQQPGSEGGSGGSKKSIGAVPQGQGGQDEDSASRQRNEGCWSKFKASCLIAYMFFLGLIDSLICLLNGLTRPYRRIRRTIDHEKREFKIRYIHHTISSQEQPTRVHLSMDLMNMDYMNPAWQSSVISDHRLAQPHSTSVSDLPPQQQQQQKDHQRETEFRRNRSHAFLLLIAIGNFAIVYSEWFCYLLLLLNHMRSSSIFSLVYPLTVFLWGMLSVPRPTKTFWTFLITYTEIIIVIKYIFQFKFIYFNDAAEKPVASTEALWLPRLFGIDKNDHYAVYDLIQLISLFLHRGYLKNNGLWRDHTECTRDLELVARRNREAKKRRDNRRPAFEGKRLQVRTHDSESQRPQRDRPSAPPAVTGAGQPFDKDEVPENHDGDVSGGTGGEEQHRRKHHRVTFTCDSWNPFAKLRRFYDKMTNPQYNKKVDVYIYMFLCEFISFWIIIFGYVSFGPSTGMGDNAFEFIKSNRIPLPFISMLLVQFIVIITDRGLFLRKQVLGKFIFQILHVVLIHGWLFFILPHITKSRFTSGLAPQLLYLTKCIYFSLSAYQIRSGYPQRILGNFLTKNYNYLNLVLFKAYLIVPFLYELRNVMDWMWTNSALSLYHWMELEDIYAKIFVLKCWRRSEVAYPTPRGVNRPAGKKALVGGLLLAFFFICFWGPLTLSSFIGATFSFNPPVLCMFTISFGGFPPSFEFTSREGNILTVPSDVFTSFKRCHEKDLQTIGFLNNFEWNDLRYITINGFSGNMWAITPPSYKALLTELGNSTSELLLHVHMYCRRPTKEIQSSHISVEDIFSRKLEPNEKEQLLYVLNGTMQNESHHQPDLSEANEWVTFNAAMPRYVLLKKDRLRPAYAQLGLQQTNVNLTFSIHRDLNVQQSWWEIKESRGVTSSDPCFSILREAVLTSSSNLNVLSLVTFNERVSDSLFGKVFNNYGIIGMYAAYIFLANRLLRTIYSNISYVIRLEELPYVDRILNLCNEIYLVRENNLLLLEEQLVAKLFFLYRSSETLIKWTRHPKHLIDRFTSHPTQQAGTLPPAPGLSSSGSTGQQSPLPPLVGGHPPVRNLTLPVHPATGPDHTTTNNNNSTVRRRKTRSLRTNGQEVGAEAGILPERERQQLLLPGSSVTATVVGQDPALMIPMTTRRRIPRTTRPHQP